MGPIGVHDPFDIEPFKGADVNIHFPSGCHGYAFGEDARISPGFFAGISTMELARVALYWFSALWNM